MCADGTTLDDFVISPPAYPAHGEDIVVALYGMASIDFRQRRLRFNIILKPVVKNTHIWYFTVNWIVKYFASEKQE